MTEPSSADKNREPDLPFIWHESEFDVAADLGLKDAVPTGEFSRGEHIHVLSEFDCSRRIEKSKKVALRLTIHLQAGEQSPSLDGLEEQIRRAIQRFLNHNVELAVEEIDPA